MLSVLEIRTRVAGSMFTTSKMIGGGVTLSTVVDNSRDFCGTTVYVRDLFHDFPVRRLSLRRRLQLARCKDVLQSLSLLNFRTQLSLVDAESNRVEWHARPAPSLETRVREIRGSSLPDMTPVDKSRGLYHIHGRLALVARVHERCDRSRRLNPVGV